MENKKDSDRTQEYNAATKKDQAAERAYDAEKENVSRPADAYDTAAAAHTHTHVLADGTVVQHSHTHTHENTKAVLNRLSRAIGHLESVKRMVEDGRDCSEVLIQLSAVKSAINNTGKIILQDHIKHCLVDAVQTGDIQEIEELNRAIEQFIK